MKGIDMRIYKPRPCVACSMSFVPTGAKSKHCSVACQFWSKVDVRSADECWRWLAATHKKGYGVFGSPKSTRRAHVVAYEFANGPVPAGLWVLHKCDNRPCVNPNHLYSGTAAENSGDMVRRGRQQRGSSHAFAILTEDSVRKLREAKGRPIDDLAAEFGVSRWTAYDAISGRRWKHVQQPENGNG